MESLRGLEPRNIIVRMPNWIGDLVMATPILSDLKKAYPQARLTAMCRSPVAELLREAPEIDELFCFSKASGFNRREELRSVVGKLRSGGYDLGILLTHSFSSAWWFWIGGVQNRIGYRSNARNCFLTQALPFPKQMESQHLVTTYKMLLEPLSIPLSTTAPKLYVSAQEVAAARALLKNYHVPEGATLVGINPGAAYGTAKCWLPERFREVTEKLLQNKELYIVYFGDVASAHLVEGICADLPERVINLAARTTLRELSSLISICNVLLTNDSGPMHIADALGVPIVALFGSTSEIITGPYRSPGVVIHKHVPCSPCYQRVCPIDFPCMKQIESSEVYEAVRRQLKPSKLLCLS